MRESKYQSKIIKSWEAYGGVVINGQYTKIGEPDLQGGIEVDGILHYLAVEVKTEVDYNRVMSGIEEDGGIYIITDIKKLKPHEPMQVHKINRNREKGGLSLFAWNFDQVLDYVMEERG